MVTALIGYVIAGRYAALVGAVLGVWVSDVISDIYM